MKLSHPKRQGQKLYGPPSLLFRSRKHKRIGKLNRESDSFTDEVHCLKIRKIKKALKEKKGINSKAAMALGITERMLSYKMKTYGFSSD